MAKNKQYKFTDSLWSELVLAVLLGIPLGFTLVGLY